MIRNFNRTEREEEQHSGYYRVDAEAGRWIEEYRGAVGLADLQAMFRSVVSDSGWRREFSGLIDFSWARLELTSNEVLRLALMMKQERHRSRGWLVYVAPNSTAFGMVRMLSYWSRSGERTKIFNTRGEAERWLDERAGAFCEAGVGEGSRRLLSAV